MKNIFLIALLGIFTLLYLGGCGKKNTLKGIFQKRSPYENYTQALKDAKLDETALGKEWINAGEAIFRDSLYVTLPYSETAYFDANKVTANGYRFIAERGQKVNVKVEILSMEAPKIFLDLFLIKEKAEHLSSGDTTELILEYEIEADGEYLLRLQPELLRGGRYTISITSAPVLAFPVWGKNSKAIASFYGAVRDAGRRRHEGVDIFAPRGTPVLAAAEGNVGRVNTNRLGGKVVWVRDNARNLNYYYAHLDSQLVSAGQRVMVGDTLGLVGNTGNAITTPPHLHFGIYSFGQGAIDPYPFLHEKNREASLATENMDLLGNEVRVSGSSVNYRLAADLKAPVIEKLPRNTLLKVLGASGKWLRIATPQNLSGFIHVSVIEPIASPLSQITFDTTRALYDYPAESGIKLANLQPGAALNVWAEMGDYLYVSTPDEQKGWLRKL